MKRKFRKKKSLANLSTEEAISFECPHCCEQITVRVDAQEYEDQSLTIDCSVCCRPIVVHTALGSEGLVLSSIDRE